jgi:hypothetical protein
VPEWTLPQQAVTGYDRRGTDHPALELWVDKSTINEVLEPICRARGVNLSVGKGYASITGIVGLLKRAEHCGRPVRVLYISDYDRNGRSMPPAAARQIESWREELDLDADVALTPLGIDPRADRRIRTAEGAGH